MTVSNYNAVEAYIDSYDFSFLKDRFSDKVASSDKQFLEIQQEFKRFVKMMLKFKGPLAVLGQKIDEFWHTFILFTPQYRQFCDNVLGRYIDHQPNTPSTPVPPIAITNFYKIYEAQYGEVNELWNEGMDAETVTSLRSGMVPNDFEYKWSGWTGG